MSDSSQTTQTTYLHSPLLSGLRLRLGRNFAGPISAFLLAEGNGGFGCCYLLGSRLQRRVAIKRMPLLGPRLPGVLASTVDRLFHRHRTTCLLAHPNIVTPFVHDFG